ncbi:hypothetical protein [Galbibacter sp. PAP.153]|uniref:hypothetical protein n=1 Tax=Galbibacter sp. PAP.153 TaxID=3104623 RepID=UPI00300BEC44
MAETYQEIVEEFQKTRTELQLDIFISFEQLESGIKFCHHVLQRLKRLIILKGFQNSREEIRFFKSLKPKPESCLLYLYMVRSFKLLMPHIGYGKATSFHEQGNS